MSALMGVFYLNGRAVTSSEVGGMAAALAFRGPDGTRTWADGPVGLGHCMLHTTAESLHEQFPLQDRAAGLTLVADARIDNRDELIAVLQVAASGSQPITDADLILAAYVRWGESCPERLLGDFAFAVWDERRRTLFCARDHFGLKPLYYHARPGTLFTFASGIRGLLALAEVPRLLDEVRVADYLAPFLEDDTRTFYADIRRLPPAHSLTVSPEGIRIHRYWELGHGRADRLASDEAYAEAFREHFLEAVRCRLRSAYPVAAQLSGGLDSSAVVCSARQLLRQAGGRPVSTYSLIFEDVPQCDERVFSRPVLAGGDLDPHFIRGDVAGPLSMASTALQHHDEVFESPNLPFFLPLRRAASESGARVLLSGFGGDSTVSHGLARLTELVERGRWATALREGLLFSRRAHRRPLPVLWNRCIRPFLPERVVGLWRHLRRDPSPDAHSLINQGLVSRLNLQDRLDHSGLERPRPPRTLFEDHRREMLASFRAPLFEETDRASAAYGLEMRYPFCDRRLVEFCLALPAQQRLGDGWTRLVFRRAMEGILPAEVQWRGGKTYLGANFAYGLRRLDGDRLRETTRKETDVLAAYVDLPRLRSACDRYLQGDSTVELGLWRAVLLALWLRQAQLSP